MMNIPFLRNTRKAYLVYGIGFGVVFLAGLVVKSFNDKIAIMTGSVHSYQLMVDKQSSQLKAVSLEKERLKRDLDDNDTSLREVKESLGKLERRCRDTSEKLENDLGSVQLKYNTLSAANVKLENKYKTLSKSNVDALSEIERLNGENRILRGKLEEVNSAKASQLIKLKDSLGMATQDRDKFKDQYSALFKQHQQSLDNVQQLQDERDSLQEERDRLAEERNRLQDDLDRLHDQIREIQRLSGGSNSSGSKLGGKVGFITSSSGSKSGLASSSSIPVMEEPRIIEEPRSGSSSSPPPPQELQGAEPGREQVPQAGQLASRQPAVSKPPAASRPPAAVSPAKPAPLVPAPPSHRPSRPTPGNLPRQADVYVPREEQEFFVGNPYPQNNNMNQHQFVKPFIQKVEKYPVYKQQYNSDDFYRQQNAYNEVDQGENVDSLQAPGHQQFFYAGLQNDDSMNQGYIGLPDSNIANLRRYADPAAAAAVNQFAGRRSDNRQQQRHSDLRFDNEAWQQQHVPRLQNIHSRDF